MKCIRRLLLAIFTVLLSICIQVFFNGSEIPSVLFAISGLLPVAGVIIVLIDILENRFGS